MDYVDKLPPSHWYIVTPPPWPIFRPPLTRGIGDVAGDDEGAGAMASGVGVRDLIGGAH